MKFDSAGSRRVFMSSEYSIMQPQRRKGLAIVSLVMGVISSLILDLFVLGVIGALLPGLEVPVIIVRLIFGLYLVGAVMAIALGSVALNKSSKEPATNG